MHIEMQCIVVALLRLFVGIFAFPFIMRLQKAPLTKTFDWCE